IHQSTNNVEITKVLEKCQLAYEESNVYKMGIWLTSQLMTEDGE
ncbi:245_t:CDS:1, partial [Gigaspora rosea]